MSKPPRPSLPVLLLAGGMRLIGHLPLLVLHGIGALIGSLLAIMPNRLRRNFDENQSLLAQAQPVDDVLPQRHAALVEAGKGMTEIARIWALPPQRLVGLVRTVHGRELLDQALADDRGLIIAAPHLGCWELLNHWLASRTSLAILYRPPRRTALEPLLQRLRGQSTVEQVRADGAGVRTLYRRLQAGGVVGILPDQQPKRGEGRFAPLFGVQALTMVLLPRLVQRTNAQVLFAFAKRLPRGHGFDIHIQAAPAGIDARSLEDACAALNAGVEACVRVAPAQYQWTYRRWSIRPDADDARARRGLRSRPGE